MGQKDSRVDAYIAKSAAFARPILEHLRAVVHTGCPEVEEALKWGVPHFTYKGMLCGMAAFKNYCAFGFWKGAMLAPGGSGAMGNFGRIAALSDLPNDKVLIALVQQAARSNESGEKRPSAPRRMKKPLPMPVELTRAFQKNPKAKAAFAEFSPSHQREYFEWITQAKTDETRAKRLATAIVWMSEGKPRNWKYMKAPSAIQKERPLPSRGKR